MSSLLNGKEEEDEDEYGEEEDWEDGGGGGDREREGKMGLVDGKITGYHQKRHTVQNVDE